MDAASRRAWYWRKQGLDGSLAGRSPAEVLAQSGWARSVGGVGPYLTLFSRAGTSRADTDAAVAALEVHELPAARGCTYVVPASDFALALKAAQASGSGEMRTARALGVADAEIDRLCDAVVRALDKGPLEPDALREAVGGAVRSVGEAGVKKGLGSTMPVALGRLQNEGGIRRVPTNGRLDQQRYRYALWRPNPLRGFKLSAEEVQVELARRYFRWIGPATIAEFQWFSGLGVKAAKAAVAPLDLAPVDEDGRLISRDERDAFERSKTPHEADYALVSSLDAISLLRRDLAGLLEPADMKRLVFSDKALAEFGGLADLPSHAILDRGRVAGLWEYDPETSSVAWCSFVPRNRALDEAVLRTEAFVRDQLGDARSFSLDSPKSRVPRIAAIRKAGRSDSVVRDQRNT